MLTAHGMWLFVVTATTIAFEVLLAVWSEQRNYEMRPLQPWVERAIFWTLIVAGAVLVMTKPSARSQTPWITLIIFVLGAFLGSFIASQAVLSHYIYNRDFW